MIRNQGGLVPVKAVVYSDPSTTTKSTAYSRDGIVGGIAVCHEEIDGMFKGTIPHAVTKILLIFRSHNIHIFSFYICLVDDTTRTRRVFSTKV